MDRLKKLSIHIVYLAVREGFEPSVRCRTHAFQAGALSHSATSPYEQT